MIRKIIIALLTFGSAGTLGAGVLSYVPTTSLPMPLQPRMDLRGFPLPGFHVLFLGNDYMYLLACQGGWISLDRTMAIPANSRVAAPRTYFNIPIAMALALLAAYPVAAFIRGPLRRWYRRQKGLCMKCGYDLRESPGRCPECGLPNNAI